MANLRSVQTVVLLTAAVAVSCLELAKEPPRYKPPPPPPGLPRIDIPTNWITQPLDHFDAQNDGTWQMRYLSNDELFTGAGYPIFIMVGGEWTIDDSYLQTGNMYDTASLAGAYLFYTEHRYYGESKLFNDVSTPNLKYLSLEQALAELAFFIADLKQQAEFVDSEVVLWGGSYAANMVVWFSAHYGHLVDVGVASSAPILAKAHFYGRLWLYQTCTEFGYFQASPTSNTMFDGLLTYEFYADICQQIFGEKYDGKFVETAAERTNILNGGLQPELTNVISVHGLQDPWHALGASTALAPSAPVLLVPGASHCFDLVSASSSDNLFMLEAREIVQQFVVNTLLDNVF